METQPSHPSLHMGLSPTWVPEIQQWSHDCLRTNANITPNMNGDPIFDGEYQLMSQLLLLEHHCSRLMSEVLMVMFG